MIFYITILTILILCSFGKYSKIKLFLSFLILFLMISLKGEIGPDYMGYLVRYINFDPIGSFNKAQGEYGWYLIEYLTYLNNWSYQMYTFFTALIGVGFLIVSQKKIKYLGFLVFIFQLVIVQLGLSGLRQFIAVCILTYAITIYLFEYQKSILKFLILVFLASLFHISALTFVIILPFLVRLKKNHLILIIILGILGLSSQVLIDNIDKYDTRYLQGSRFSSGAWLRFAISSIILFLGFNKSNKNLFNLGIFILLIGLILGVINSIALHRFNYYFYPLSCLILIRNYKDSLIKKQVMTFVYVISIFYFIFWFNFSEYSDSFSPYVFFFN